MSTTHIPVRRGGQVVAFALVDEADAHLVAGRWALNSTGYATARRDGRTVLMHRHILGLAPGDGLEVDHVNCARLDNRRRNLRVLTHAENHHNRRPRSFGTSKFRGVYWNKAAGKWFARVKIDGRHHWVGAFDDETEAGNAAAEYRRQNMSGYVEHEVA